MTPIDSTNNQNKIQCVKLFKANPTLTIKICIKEKT